MSQMNYEKFLTDLVKPLVIHPDEVVVKIFSEEDDIINVQIMVNADDLGRVIGKKGRVANSIRTLAYACSSKNGKKIEISIDSF
mgnify:CR=1 FL=1